MHILRYSADWADLVVDQLATTYQTRCVGVWGYACLVVGREFEGVVERNWLAVSRLTGPHLHFFALLPPPREFVQERLNQLRDIPQSLETEWVKRRLLDILVHRDIDRSILVREKVNLLSDLRDAGLKSDQYADFLFLRFRNDGADVEIDVVAAKSAGIPADADDRDYLACIERMSRIAAHHYDRNSPITAVAKDMAFLWDVRVAIGRAGLLLGYIKSFLNGISRESS